MSPISTQSGNIRAMLWMSKSRNNGSIQQYLCKIEQAIITQQLQYAAIFQQYCSPAQYCHEAIFEVSLTT
jgi:hypothetical protein